MNPELAIIATLCGLVAGGLVWFGWSLVENIRHTFGGGSSKPAAPDDADIF